MKISKLLTKSWDWVQEVLIIGKYAPELQNLEEKKYHGPINMRTPEQIWAEYDKRRLNK